MTRQYVYRNYPCTICEEPWYVSGTVQRVVGGVPMRGGGVLEWCWSEDDARDMLRIMSGYPNEFSDLKIGQCRLREDGGHDYINFKV